MSDEMGELELLRRLADTVRINIEVGSIKPGSYVGIAWRDYAERYQLGPVTAEAQAVFEAAGIPFTPKAALHRVPAAQQPAPEQVKNEALCTNCGKAKSTHHSAFLFCNMGYFSNGETITKWEPQPPAGGEG